IIRDGFRCKKCRVIPIYPTTDHILPKIFGGTSKDIPIAIGSEYAITTSVPVGEYMVTNDYIEPFEKRYYTFQHDHTLIEALKNGCQAGPSKAPQCSSKMASDGAKIKVWYYWTYKGPYSTCLPNCGIVRNVK